MSHLAAFIPSPKALLEVKEVTTPQPGSNELLVKNELIGLLPIDYKLAKAGILPLQYPAILGSTFGGTVVAVGKNVSGFNVGDKVVTAKTAGTVGNEFSAFQQYALSRDITTTNIPKTTDLDTAVSLAGNLTTVVGLFNHSAGLAKPNTEGPTPTRDQKVLIYGGSSNFGSLSVQYVTQAGYTVVTTSSPKHESVVSTLGASRVIDHTQDKEALTKALIAEGPYDLVVDSISTPDTLQITAGVVSAQGGSEVYALQPAFVPEILPEGVTRKFGSWSLPFAEEANAELLRWTFGTYFPWALEQGRLVTTPTQKVPNGLNGLNDALNILAKGVSWTKIVVEPWE